MKKPSPAIGYTAAAAALCSLLAFLPALTCNFINLDDPYYITNNPLIKTLDYDALSRIFTKAHLAAWLPLTYLSLAIDYHFWGDNPFGYHLTNVVLHSANTGLVVLLAGRLLVPGVGEGTSKPRAWQYPLILFLAGLLWGLHPMRVESVVWAAERKDVLNGLFVLGSLLFYLGYVRRSEDEKWGHPYVLYMLSLLFFILSLLAKQVSVTLPVVLLLLDWYPLRRLGSGRALPLVVEKIPYFLISLAISLLTVHFAAVENKLISMGNMPLYVRFLVSGNAIFEYCRFSLFPLGISPYQVLIKPLPYAYLFNTVVVAAVTLFFLRIAPHRRGAAVTWFLFIILLSPVLAFIQAGDDIALAARYTYLPSMAFAIAGSHWIVQFWGRLLSQGRRWSAIALAGVVAVFLTTIIVLTLRLIPVWKDTGTFWSRVIEVSPVGRAFGDRGVFYLMTGRSADAVGDFSAAITIAFKSDPKLLYNLYAFRGVALSDIGRYPDAVADFNRAIALYPHPTYFQLRGAAFLAMGRTADAEKDFRSAGPNPPAIDWFEKSDNAAILKGHL